MLDFFAQLFDTSDFVPRWHCGRWSPEHGWLHIASDLGVWSAYVAIPWVLAYFVLRRGSIPFRTVFWLFAAFILACGTTHLMEALIFWWPAYRLAGFIKLLTALVSWGTVLALVPVVPRALAMRTPEELEKEIAARKDAEIALQRANDQLKQQLEELRNSEVRVRLLAESARERELLRTIIDTIPVMLTLYEPNTRVLRLNPEFERVIGWSSRDAEGVSLMEECYPDPKYREQVRQFMESCREGWMDIRMRTRDGRGIDTSWANIRLSDGTHVGIGIDITDRLQLTNRLREADRKKDEFLATLAHELRNPLAPIGNALELLRHARGNAAVIEQARELMARQLGQMIRLVDDLLDVARISRGKVQLRKERTELATAVRSALESVRPLMEARQHELTVTLPEETIFLDADQTRLAQVIANLLNNAAKYTDQGGKVWLTARRQANNIVLVVRDTGIGISAEHLPHLFEIFSQAAPALERSQGGLGIGLSLVRALVELHGGTVEARSDGVGRGSEFIIHLPIQEVADSRSSEKRRDEGNGMSTRKYRILVVDDNHDTADSMAEVLGFMGHQTRTAYDGQEAVEAAESYCPEVILLDIGLPKLNGYEAARRIRAQPAGKKMTLIAITGWGQDEDKRRAMEAGFDYHMTKPVDAATVEKVLETILATKS